MRLVQYWSFSVTGGCWIWLYYNNTVMISDCASVYFCHFLVFPSLRLTTPPLSMPTPTSCFFSNLKHFHLFIPQSLLKSLHFACRLFSSGPGCLRSILGCRHHCELLISLNHCFPSLNCRMLCNGLVDLLFRLQSCGFWYLCWMLLHF